MIVSFYEHVDDAALQFAVILAKYDNRWIFCKHHARNTYELPGGHRKHGERILDAAKRELQEETGALAFDIYPVCVYSVTDKSMIDQPGTETFGMLYFAEIHTLSTKLHSEIEKIELFDDLPKSLTYPLIHPMLFHEYLRRTEPPNHINFHAFWQAVLSQDAPTLAAFFHPDAVVNWHCTGEHFTAAEFVRINCAYPGSWDGKLQRIEQVGNLYITVTHVYPTDRSASFHVTSFFRLKDEKILSLDEYWADDGPPPSWRQD